MNGPSNNSSAFFSASYIAKQLSTLLQIVSTTTSPNVTKLQKPKHQGDLIHFLHTQMYLSHLSLISLKVKPLLTCIHNSWEGRGYCLMQSQRTELMAPLWGLPWNQKAEILTHISMLLVVFCPKMCVVMTTQNRICKT